MSNRTISIRVDAGGEIGAGHFMRCLTLADALRPHGIRSRFISRRMPGSFGSMVRQRDHELDLLETDISAKKSDDLPHSHWLRTSQFYDAEQVLGILSDRPTKWLLVDHYALDARWESSVRANVDSIFVIDDIANRPHDCDMLLDQNLHDAMETRYAGLVPAQCRLLLGPKYALLRNDFSKLRDTVGIRQGPVQKILILMGGTDPSNQTAKAVRALRAVRGYSFDVDVIVGAEHPALEDVRGLCNAVGFRCHVQIDGVAALMGRADLALGACGSASWERCCLGLPAICISIASNQTSIASALAARGAILNLGNADDVTEEHLTQATQRLVDHVDRLAALSNASFALVDGKGAERVCQALMDAL